ncbi:exostosin-like 2 isoform X2 [Pseudophryne corroboree]|uniref:exostosin-like 2 isoform X2 n=1 Tax=Pseudophryne corroboree TaxID=495146 RepID=UPI003081D235
MRFLGKVFRMKMLRASCAFLVLLLFLLGAMAALLPTAHEGPILGVRRGMSLPISSALSSFTLIMQTYNRTDLLLKMLNHYQAMTQLHCVIVVWNNVGQDTPQELWESLGPHPVPVYFKKQGSNLMRNRLQNFPEIETQAVLMMDDDTLVSAYDISFAFSVWQQFPSQIVGFVPRKHVVSPSGILSYGSFELQAPDTGHGDQYSMILIGAAFFHQHYLQLFQELPAPILDMIDKTQNCDDLTMNFLVANYTGRASGVLVKPVDMRNLEKDAGSGYTGMWHRAEHLLQRSYCLNKLTEMYGKMPLVYSNIMISQFGFPNYANHKSKV